MLRVEVLPSSGNMRVATAIEAFLAAVEAGRALNKHGRPYKSSAIRDLRGALEGYVEPALGRICLVDVGRGDVQHLVDSLTPEKSGSRVRTVVNAIHSLYAWAEARELVDRDSALRVRLTAMNATPRDRVATVTEMDALLAALEPAYALPYALAVYATARRAEIRHARIEDVDLAVRVIYLGADERGRKSRAAQRAVPLVKPLASMIRRELLRRGDRAERRSCVRGATAGVETAACSPSMPAGAGRRRLAVDRQGRQARWRQGRGEDHRPRVPPHLRVMLGCRGSPSGCGFCSDGPLRARPSTRRCADHAGAVHPRSPRRADGG
jgi:integrase